MKRSLPRCLNAIFYSTLHSKTQENMLCTSDLQSSILRPFCLSTKSSSDRTLRSSDSLLSATIPRSAKEKHPHTSGLFSRLTASCRQLHRSSRIEMGLCFRHDIRFVVYSSLQMWNLSSLERVSMLVVVQRPVTFAHVSNVRFFCSLYLSADLSSCITWQIEIGEDGVWWQV